MLLISCTSAEQKDFAAGLEEEKLGHFHTAVGNFERVISRSPTSSLGIQAIREAARISFYEIKDFSMAVQFYQKLVLSSPDAEERLKSQRQIVSIYFDQLTDYQRSVLEINKLVPMLHDQKEKKDYKIKLARSYYYLSNFLQAENEADEFLRSEPSVDQKFDMILLKGNIQLAQKNYTKSTELFRELMKEFPQRAIKENVALTLSVNYEEMKDYKGAIEILQSIRSSHPMPEYIDIRIKRLSDRMKNQPGARGKYRK
ncbi:MAG: hypothetical protein COT73_08470 [Bdellovibrio sp. CG10_big_fil_rev_8_21_14_0_10_47_8]|nr:MAG: hypothetical protein COT73_08470 [Bdellovibrio sp. CG10_big_fil_rev_8_21_14_0_10_47_8]